MQEMFRKDPERYVIRLTESSRRESFDRFLDAAGAARPPSCGGVTPRRGPLPPPRARGGPPSPRPAGRPPPPRVAPPGGRRVSWGRPLAGCPSPGWRGPPRPET